MTDESLDRARLGRWGAMVGLLAGGALAGGILVGSLSANAATNASTGSHTGRASSPAHGTPAHEGREKAVTGANATQAQAPAVKSVGSGRAGAVTTDVTGSGYEVTVTKSDGTRVDVHMDGSFNIDDHGH